MRARSVREGGGNGRSFAGICVELWGFEATSSQSAEGRAWPDDSKDTVNRHEQWSFFTRQKSARYLRRQRTNWSSASLEFIVPDDNMNFLMGVFGHGGHYPSAIRMLTAGHTAENQNLQFDADGHSLYSGETGRVDIDIVLSGLLELERGAVWDRHARYHDSSPCTRDEGKAHDSRSNHGAGLSEAARLTTPAETPFGTISLTGEEICPTYDDSGLSRALPSSLHYRVPDWPRGNQQPRSNQQHKVGQNDIPWQSPAATSPSLLLPVCHNYGQVTAGLWQQDFIMCSLLQAVSTSNRNSTKGTLLRQRSIHQWLYMLCAGMNLWRTRGNDAFSWTATPALLTLLIFAGVVTCAYWAGFKATKMTSERCFNLVDTDCRHTQLGMDTWFCDANAAAGRAANGTLHLSDGTRKDIVLPMLRSGQSPQKQSKLKRGKASRAKSRQLGEVTNGAYDAITFMFDALSRSRTLAARQTSGDSLAPIVDGRAPWNSIVVTTSS